MSDRARILVLGASGQVGWELCRSLGVLGEVLPVSRHAVGHRHCDLSDLAAVEALLDGLTPDVVVNAAAYTAVDKAESEPDAAYTLNAELPRLLGAWAAARDAATVLHYSTDYVFDGTLSGPYTERDATGPVNVYGASKLAGDQALMDSGARVWILRVSWVYSLRGHNFLLTMRRLMAERDGLRIVDDQIGAPTWARSIADASAALLAQVMADPAAADRHRGLFHLAPGGRTSWFGFASEIRDLLGLTCALEAIGTADYPTPASRPKNSLLDGTQLQAAFGISLPDWRQSLRLCLDN